MQTKLKAVFMMRGPVAAAHLGFTCNVGASVVRNTMNYNPVSFQDAFKSADVSRDNTVDVTELKGLFQHIGQWGS